MKFTVNQAAEIVGVVRQTMYKHLKSRGISTETDMNGELLIDQSELTRVYGNDRVASGLRRQEEGPRIDAPRQPAIAPAVMAGDPVAVVRLEAEVEKFKALAEKAEEATEYVKGLFEAEKAERQQATKLLEDLRSKESRAGELEQAVKALEDRVNTYEKSENERRQKIAAIRQKRTERLNAQLEKERHERERLQAANSRPWYQKLFG